MDPFSFSPARGAGFTLLELIVVMALMSFMTALVGPRVLEWASAARYRADVDRVLGALQALPTHTYFSGRSRQVTNGADLGLTLPPGWALAVDRPLRYEANGMTNGALVTLRNGEATLAIWRVLPPAGEVQLLETL